MKFFVTDAQLETWHQQHVIDLKGARAQQDFVVRGLRDEFEAERARLTERHDAEIQRLREDRAAELARVADPAQPFVTHLREEVAFWRLLYTAERQRNDVSTDQRLAERGLGGITGPTRPLAPEPAANLMDEFLRQSELGQIGDAAGVER